MARTTLTVTEVTRVGQDIATLGAANADGHSVANGGDVWLEVDNADASPHTVTITTPRTVDGQDVAEYTQVVAAGERMIFGPFPTTTFNDQSTGTMNVDFDAVTSVTIGAFRLGR
jgi:hypothetical protein